MAKSKPFPSLERLREVFFVDENGWLYWRKKSHPSKPDTMVGKKITTRRSDGYYQVKLDGRAYRVHRIVWALAHNQDPGSLQIDHINGDRGDNRLSNLRLCSASQNMLNKSRQQTNKSGVKGVCRVSSARAKPWRAYCRQLLGAFATREEAVVALKAFIEQNEDKSFYRFDSFD
jgi:hypothetical protein